MKVKHFIFTLISLFTLSGLTHITAQTKKAVGVATYYGHKFHGRRTSDGSTYHRDSLTCAHRTLPFGTLLKVRNTKNGREVVVKVTDRGPFRRGGIVDLSFAAAKEIGMVSSGVVRVEVEPVPDSGRALAKRDNSQRNYLPELQLLDPADGQYYTMTEWVKRGKDERAKAKAEAARRNRTNYLANNKAKAPAWHVMDNKLTAKAGN